MIYKKTSVIGNTNTPVLVFLGFMLITLAAVIYIHMNANLEDSLEFESTTTTSQQRIVDRLNNYVALLRGTGGLFAASGDVDADEFIRYVRRLNLSKYYKGIRGIGYAERTEPNETDEVTRKIGNTYFTGFKIRPEGEREVYFPIVYLEPQDERNKVAIGYDMFSEKVRKSAMETAWYEGKGGVSGKVTLVQEIDEQKQAGFLIYFPVYTGGVTPETLEQRKALLEGFVYSPFRVGDLLVDLAHIAESEGVYFEVYDSDVLNKENLMFTSLSGDGFSKARIKGVHLVDIGGRNWYLKFYSNDNFPYSNQKTLTPFIFITGMLVGSLLFKLIKTQDEEKHKAQQAAEALKISENLLKESKEKITNIIESITDGFIALDKQWNFTYVNKEASRVLGRPKKSFIGKNIWKEFPEYQETSFAKLFEFADKRNKSMTVEDYFETNNAWYQVRVYPSKDGLSVYFQDITERVGVEKQKDEFLSVASHELRTPITSIKAFGQMLEKNFRRKGDVAYEELMIKINRQVDRLSNLILDLLDVSRIQSGKLMFRKKDFNLTELAFDITEEMRRITDKTIILKKPAKAIKIYGDRERLGQVITNLISNAIKYSPKSKTVKVVLETLKGKAKVCVIDNGIGISKNEQKKIFQRFYRGESAKKNNLGGIGLGLFISNEIIHRHKGRMSVESVKGKGSVFCFKIPLIKQS